MNPPGTRAIPRKLRQQYRAGQLGTPDFDETLSAAVATANLNLHRSSRKRDSESLAFNTLLSEILDQLCRTSEARHFIAKEARTWLSAPLPDNVDLRREVIRMSAQFAIVEYYRDGDYGNAERLLRECIALLPTGAPANGDDLELSAFIHYNMGRVLRQKHDYDSAEKSFYRALMDCEASSHDGDTDRKVYSSYRSALILAFGIATTSSARGKLREGLCNAIAAQILLSRLTDPIHLAYAHLVRADIERSLAASGVGDYTQARRFAEEALALFNAHGDRFVYYAERAHFEIAKNLYNCGKYQSALDQLPSGPFSFTDSEDRKRRSDVEILRCRILCSQVRSGLDRSLLLDAARAADNALAIAAGPPSDDRSVAEALIAKAQAQIEMPDTHGARENLMRAYELAQRQDIEDPVRRVVCILYLALSHAKDNDAVKANEYWSQWQRLKSSIENSWVHKRAEQVGAEIAKLDKPFVLSATKEQPLTHSDHDRALRRFLLLQADRRGGTARERAGALGISRETYYKWQKELNGKSDQ